MTLIAFHGNSELQAEVIAEMAAHAKADSVDALAAAPALRRKLGLRLLASGKTPRRQAWPSVAPF